MRSKRQCWRNKRRRKRSSRRRRRLKRSRKSLKSKKRSKWSRRSRNKPPHQLILRLQKLVKLLQIRKAGSTE